MLGWNCVARRNEIVAEQGIYNASIVETQSIGDWCYSSPHLTPRLGTADKCPFRYFPWAWHKCECSLARLVALEVVQAHLGWTTIEARIRLTRQLSSSMWCIFKHKGMNFISRSSRSPISLVEHHCDPCSYIAIQKLCRECYEHNRKIEYGVVANDKANL